MDIRKIKKLIDLIDETGVTEIEIKEGEESVRISRQHAAGAPVVTYAAPAPVAQAAAPKASAPSEPAAAVQTHNGHTVNSPMVGTAYLSPSPDAPKFVSIGSNVKAGDTLCIVEAMKMFNEIESDVSGKVTAILIDNGHAVEFGQPLFVIES